MKILITVVTLMTLVCLHSPTYGQWQKNIIDNNFPGTIVSIADMDGDNDPDVAVTSEGAGKVVWYENNNYFWTKHPISNSDGIWFAYIGDIDGDDTMDVVASGSGKVAWYENNHPIWPKHFIDANSNGAGYANVCDIDGDDTLDVVTGGYNVGGDVVWYENNLPTWTQHIIRSTWENGVTSLHVGDIDGDEKLDVVVVGSGTDRVAWFRNENAGLSWTEYTIDDNLDGAWHLYIADIDGDDTLDVVATGQVADDVVWYENNHPAWNKHTIDADLDGARTVDVADIDGDEKLDVVATGRTSNGKVVWYKNNHPDSWEKHVIESSIDRPNYASTADIDGDNAFDVVVAVEGGADVVWYKNPNTTVAYAKSFEVYPKYIPPQQGDTLKLIAQIWNPENHQVTVHALIQGNNFTFKDSLQLFDDGLHNDSLASDNIFGGIKWLDELDEDYFDISLRTTDSDESITTYSSEGHFTTIGPLIADHYEISSQVQDMFKLNLFLINNGSIASATQVRAELSTTDTNVTTIGNNNLHFGTIDPGQIKTYSFTGFNVYTQNNPESVKFDVHISSQYNLLWSDTITVDIPPLVSVEDVTSSIPTEFELYQSYPNPFNPTTIIKYSIPKSSFVTLKIFDVLGNDIAILVNEEKPVGNYKVEFDGIKLSSGIYFYRLQTGDFMDTKKMILMK